MRGGINGLGALRLLGGQVFPLVGDRDLGGKPCVVASDAGRKTLVAVVPFVLRGPWPVDDWSSLGAGPPC